MYFPSTLLTEALDRGLTVEPEMRPVVIVAVQELGEFFEALGVFVVGAGGGPVGQHPLHANAVVGKPGDHALQEACGGDTALVGQHFHIGPARGVIDGHVDEFEAYATPGWGLGAACGLRPAGIEALAAPRRGPAQALV